MTEYTGWKKWFPTDEELVNLYQDGECPLELLENEYLIVINKEDNTASSIYKKKNGKLEKINRASIKVKDPKDGRYNKIYNPRNPEQACAFDALHDPDTTVKVITGSWGTGKAVPNNTLIPTPAGFIEMGKLKVGDYVFGSDGKPTRIIGVFPQGLKDVYEVSFVHDNRKALCCKDHLWTVLKKSHGKKVTEVLSTQQLLEHGLSRNIITQNLYYYQIPITKPVEYFKRKFDIDPYVIGSFIGNGCNTSLPLTLSSGDPEQVEIIRQLLCSPEAKKAKSTYNYHFRLPINQQTKKIKNYQTKDIFKNYPEIMKQSHLKRIPQEYLLGDIQQRWALLQGLMDTDGHCSATKGRVSYTTTSEQLSLDIMQLCYSLGLCCNRIVDTRKKHKNSHNCYTITIQTTPENKINLFRLSRKKQRCISSYEQRQKHQRNGLTIKEIKKLNYQEEMTCILVDSKDHLFLMNDYIVTHNTMLMVTAALEALREKTFEKIVWIRNNVDVKDTKDLGALPGDAKEKLLPFLGPFIDHVGGEKRALKMIEEGQLEIQPLQFLRGRDIKNAIIMCSESENLSKEHIQLIIARAAEGSAVWMDGDIVQRDKTSFENSRGIETMIDRLKGNPLFAHVKLVKSERSATAALADKLD